MNTPDIARLLQQLRKRARFNSTMFTNTLDWQVAETIAALLDRLERAEGRIAAAAAVIETGYRGVDKADRCEHGRYGFEDCIACYDEQLMAALHGAAPPLDSNRIEGMKS